MKKNLLLKNTLRYVRKTKGRFVSIMAIIAIGCAFFSGVKASCPFMKSSAWEYLADRNLADLHLKSDLGFTDADVKYLSEYQYAEDVSAGCTAELFAEDGSDRLIFSAYSYSADDGINKLTLESGRFPENDNECLIDYSIYKGRKFNVGDKITLSAENSDETDDILKISEFTVCGTVRSPVYISFERGAASVGNGTVNGYIYLPENSFAYDVYTDIYMTIDGLSEVDPYSDDYDGIIESVQNELEAMSADRLEMRRAELRVEADKELDKAREELNDARTEYENGEKEYSDGIEKIESEKSLLDEQKAEYEASLSEFNSGKDEYEAAVNNVRELESGCELAENCLETYAGSYTPTLPDQISERLKNIQQAADSLGVPVNLKELTAIYMITSPEDDPEGKAAAGEQLGYAVTMVRYAVSEAEKELEKQSEILEQSEKQLDDAKAVLDEYTAQLESAEEELADARNELDSAKEEISSATSDINDEEEQLEKRLKDAGWYILSRDDYNPYYSHYEEDAERIDAIAKVFPIFFIMIAALVCICTMTRMVEEQRTEMGTLRSLGIGSSAIAAQYMGYAAAASVIGSTIGVPIGLNLIPRVIFYAYQTMYTFPFIKTPLRTDYYIGCLVVSLLCTSLSALAAQRGAAAENPASLIRPRPPASGKRILLENITFLWKRMKFTHKVTFRNLFRYKVKLLMTLLGIAGCTALLLTGFGLQYAVSSIVDRQFGNIFLYDAIAVINEKADTDELSRLDTLLGASDNIAGYMKVRQTAANVSANGRKAEQCYIFSAADPAELRDFIRLRERKTGLPLNIPDSGVIINEKLSLLLNVSAGDLISIDGAAYPVKISGITENYTMNYVYMSADIRRELFGDAEENAVLINMSSSADRDSLSSELIAENSIIGVSISADDGNKFKKLVSSLNLVVIMIIIFSGALATVILFNLASINITERVRELATIKVLGFFDGEVTSYILRENVISTVLGTCAGIPLGILLERFVVKTAEVDVVMFAPDIAPHCYAAAAVITLIFAMIVNFIMHFRMKGIDMAASLKAAE